MLTQAQLNALRVDLAQHPELNTTSDIVEHYNAVLNAAFKVWRTSAPTADLFDAITWANYTPQDLPDGTLLWQNRALQCQGKQFNLQTMLVGRDIINPSKANIRAGLQDALTAIPSGGAGVSKSGGWNNVALVLQRSATEAERLCAVGPGDGAQATPATLTFEGGITLDDASNMR